jgi:hypothetical protein
MCGRGPLSGLPSPAYEQGRYEMQWRWLLADANLRAEEPTDSNVRRGPATARAQPPSQALPNINPSSLSSPTHTTLLAKALKEASCSAISVAKDDRCEVTLVR